MKGSIWIITAALFVGSAVSAAAPSVFAVSTEDLETAGIRDAFQIPPTSDRFLPPVSYFRAKDRLSAKDAKKDCADCDDLVAVYVADVSTVPNWVIESQLQFVKMGGRLQLRTYIASVKRIVIVTGPSESAIRNISKQLVSKFSR